MSEKPSPGNNNLSSSLLLLSRFSHVRLCATPYTAAHQAPPSLGFSRQEHWSGLPVPSPYLSMYLSAPVRFPCQEDSLENG